MAAPSSPRAASEKDARSSGGEPGVDAAHPDEPTAVPELSDPKKRHEQDSQPVEGGQAIDLPPGAREQQHPPVQG